MSEDKTRERLQVLNKQLERVRQELFQLQAVQYRLEGAIAERSMDAVTPAPASEKSSDASVQQ